MAEWKKKRNIVHHYNQLASVYDIQYADEQKAKIEAVLEKVALENNNFVLDVGCGTGLLFPYIANKVQLFIGIDISRELLKKAETRKECCSNIHILLADADHLPFRFWSFNITFAITLLQNSPNPLVTLQEIKRVSKKHARIMVTGLKKKFTQKTFTIILENAKLELSALETDNNLKDYIAKCHFKTET
ncbi:MAG: class I SAM-dependent methyltransferase [Candidatus Bathyarchaeota archaeon]|nr:class I SAM-dependent methyltransferase [Candidatus Bathyarchaeota archaeon]MDH5732577.1 class I SAM-dependent methyltransferase [Candidatus Bathyarchaeota archaeon]